MGINIDSTHNNNNKNKNKNKSKHKNNNKNKNKDNNNNMFDLGDEGHHHDAHGGTLESHVLEVSLAPIHFSLRVNHDCAGTQTVARYEKVQTHLYGPMLRN